MLFLMNMVIMYKVHHLHTEKEEENLKKLSESTHVDTKLKSLYNNRISKIHKGFLQIFSAVTKMLLHNMAKIEKGSGIACIVPPCGNRIYHKVAAPYF